MENLFMKIQTLVNTLKLALILALLAAAVIAALNSVSLPLLLATVSWNG